MRMVFHYYFLYINIMYESDPNYTDVSTLFRENIPVPWNDGSYMADEEHTRISYLNNQYAQRGLEYTNQYSYPYPQFYPYPYPMMIPTMTPGPISNISQNVSKDRNKFRNRTSSKCYTCKPRAKVKKHIISKTDNTTFHHDLWKRPLIIATPNKHYHTIFEMSPDYVHNFLNDIRQFTKFWNLDDFQIMFNFGRWQSHHHCHLKIRANEQAIARMRRDHFEKIKLDSNYEHDTNPPDMYQSSIS